MSLAGSNSTSKSRLNVYALYLMLSLIFLATSPALLLGEGNRNLGLITFMFISPLFMLRKALTTEAVLLLGFALSIVYFPAFIHAGETRWSTIFYSLMFCALFISYDGTLRRGHLKLVVFLNIIRYLILSYTMVLVIQQFCVLFGLPIFNVSNYDPSEPWKLNSLSSEPSHSARIVGLLMLSYIVGNRLAALKGTHRIASRKQNAFVWLCFFWTMITMVSATSLIMTTVVLLAYAQKNGIVNYVAGLLMASVMLFLLPDRLVGRVFDIFLAFLTFDYVEILMADHSGGMRVAPMMVLLNYVEVFSAKGLFGNGVDSVSFFLSDYIWGVEEGATGGGLLALWYEYGLIAFLFFVLFTLKATAATKTLENFISWFMLIFLTGVNSQMVWLAIILLHTLNYYRRGAGQIG